MCWYCGSPVTEQEPIGRSFRCSTCGKDLRVCKNCRFCVSGARGDCTETNAEKVSDRERANFCDWFSLNPQFREKTSGNRKDQDKASAAKTAFDNLFN